MKEQLYAIPVNDAFDKGGECPVCNMYEELKKSALEFTLGPSYMEDDVRMETNRLGFCREHVKLLYDMQNRLGLALMLKTHMDELIGDMEKLTKSGRTQKGGLFSAKGPSAVASYVNSKNSSCFVCERIDRLFERYLATVFHLYANDPSFAEKMRASKGFCLEHYGVLYEKAASELKGKVLEQFTKDLDTCFMEGMKRVRDDVDWYTRKFDYRFKDEPWKNSKDAVQRAMEKTAGLYYDEEDNKQK